MDTVPPETRSRMMSGIKNKNTKPEIVIRKYLHAAGYRFRLHKKNLPGKPDISMKKYNAIIFVHGCFWHGHDCRYFKVPKTNTEFWKKKIEINRQRDLRDVLALMNIGWRVCIIWECSIREIQKKRTNLLEGPISDWLKGNSGYLEIGIENSEIQPTHAIYLL
ncbi:MAG: very short patch repair endonuclease [Rectinemataceae bacterium]|nr:very short patch repair endonuclease [Rectinemataceae bacterium]